MSIVQPAGPLMILVRQGHVHYPHEGRASHCAIGKLVYLLQLLRASLRSYGHHKSTTRFQLGHQLQQRMVLTFSPANDDDDDDDDDDVVMLMTEQKLKDMFGIHTSFMSKHEYQWSEFQR